MWMSIGHALENWVKFSHSLCEKFRVPADRVLCGNFWNKLCQKWLPPFFNRLFKKCRGGTLIFGPLPGRRLAMIANKRIRTQCHWV